MQIDLNQNLEDLKLLVYRSDHIRQNFLNDFKPESEIQLKVKNLIDEYLQTLVADAVICSDLLFEISTCESEDDFQIIIDSNDVEYNEGISNG